LLQRLPFIGAALIMALLAGCGLPGFANFVGEVMVFFGSWKAFPLVTGFAVWGGLIIGAVYMLRAIRNILHGPLGQKCGEVADAPHAWRKLPFALLLASLFVFGFFPGLLTEKIKPSVEHVVNLAASQSTAGLPLTPSLSPSGGESGQRPGEGESGTESLRLVDFFDLRASTGHSIHNQ
jgi:NADH:ubiquinone oxidoreductase subunit 4 (subunit M)